MSTKTYKYRFQSKNTKLFVKSSKDDKEGDYITTTPDGASSDTILTYIPGKIPLTAQLIGESGLYISLVKEVPGTRLTWSKDGYSWQILANAQDPLHDFFIIPLDGPNRDLYWIDKKEIGEYVIVQDGKDIVAPQNEWFITPAN